MPCLWPVSVLLPTHSGLGTGPAAVPKARYREHQLQLHPLPGHQPGSHQRAGTSGTQWDSPNKDGACNWPWGQGWTRSSWRSRGRASSHAWHTAETPGAGQPSGPDSPTAQLVGFAPSPGGNQSGSQELCLLVDFQIGNGGSRGPGELLPLLFLTKRLSLGSSVSKTSQQVRVLPGTGWLLREQSQGQTDPGSRPSCPTWISSLIHLGFFPSTIKWR